MEIPLRPNGTFKIGSKDDMDLLTYFVLFRVSKEGAFARFYPEYAYSNGKLTDRGKAKCKEYFAHAEHVKYIDAYKQTLQEFCGGTDSGYERVVEITDARKEKALTKLLKRAIELAESRDVDPDTLKTITEIFKRLNILKEEEDKVLPPVRYLPARCKSECAYRLYCESAITNLEMINGCNYCKALQCAKENGFEYNPTSLLDVPQEIIDKIDKKNNVDLNEIIKRNNGSQV